jgi:hypothetical protein
VHFEFWGLDLGVDGICGQDVKCLDGVDEFDCHNVSQTLMSDFSEVFCTVRLPDIMTRQIR